MQLTYAQFFHVWTRKCKLYFVCGCLSLIFFSNQQMEAIFFSQTLLVPLKFLLHVTVTTEITTVES